MGEAESCSNHLNYLRRRARPSRDDFNLWKKCSLFFFFTRNPEKFPRIFKCIYSKNGDWKLFFKKLKSWVVKKRTFYKYFSFSATNLYFSCSLSDRLNYCCCPHGQRMILVCPRSWRRSRIDCQKKDLNNFREITFHLQTFQKFIKYALVACFRFKIFRCVKKWDVKEKNYFLYCSKLLFWNLKFFQALF